MKLLICESANLARFALPYDGCFVFAMRCHVPIEAVVREIELAAHEPLRPGAIPFQNLVPLLEPVQLARDTRPERVGIVNRLLIEPLVLREVLDMGLRRKFRRALELALLLQNGIDIGGSRINDGFIGHGEDLNAEELYSRPWK